MQLPLTHRASVWQLDPATYSVHELHQANRNFVESNCYIDIWIELIHAAGYEVYPALAFTLATDFEDDQWTFYKPSFHDLNNLYGFDVQEMYLWGPLHNQILKQLQGKKWVLLEADAFYLPDTLETDYRKNHVKTTIAIDSIDLETRTLRYFHNASFFELAGEDFDGLFYLNCKKAENYLPPYCEFVKLNHLSDAKTVSFQNEARALAEYYFRRIPSTNPIKRFANHFSLEIPNLCASGLEVYHHYAFGALRQLGSCFELTAYFLRQLQKAEQHQNYDLAAEHFEQICQMSKAMILKGARMVNRNNIKDVSADFDQIADHWQQGMDALRAHFE